MDDIDQDVKTLENLQNTLSKDAQSPSQMDLVESSLTRFVDDAFNIARAEFEFQKAVQAEIVLNRLKTMTDNQIIALLSNTGVNSADKISKTMNPWVQLATARQQAQIAAESAERTAAIQTGQSPASLGGTAMRDLNESASKEVLQGVASLSQILEFAINAAKDQSKDAPKEPAAETKPEEKKDE